VALWPGGNEPDADPVSARIVPLTPETLLGGCCLRRFDLSISRDANGPLWLTIWTPTVCGQADVLFRTQIMPSDLPQIGLAVAEAHTRLMG
jgi:hypothetical protein